MAWFREWLRDEEQAAGPARRPPAEPAPGRADASGGRGPRPGGSRGAGPAEAASPYPGESYGLPEHGPDSVAVLPLRGLQFVLDLLLAGAVGAVFAFPVPPSLSLAVWVLLVLVPVAVVGRTPAMALLGMRVARMDGAATVGFGWAAARTVSLFFVLPAFVVDADARGLQDRISRTIVLRTR